MAIEATNIDSLVGMLRLAAGRNVELNTLSNEEHAMTIAVAKLDAGLMDKDILALELTLSEDGDETVSQLLIEAANTSNYMISRGNLSCRRGARTRISRCHLNASRISTH